MNKARRKAIGTIIATLEEVQSDTSTVAEEEQEFADNMPENMQGSEKFEKAEEAAQELADIHFELTDIINRLEEVTQ